MPSPASRRLLVVPLLVWALVACSPAPPAEPSPVADLTTSTTAPPVPVEPEAALAAFAGCLEEQGITVGELRLDATGRPLLSRIPPGVEVSADAFREAAAACAPILIEAGLLDLRQDPELQAAVIARLEAFARCMREEGLTSFPDPDPTFSGLGPAFPPDEIPYAHPGFRAASATCRTVSLDQ